MTPGGRRAGAAPHAAPRLTFVRTRVSGRSFVANLVAQLLAWRKQDLLQPLGMHGSAGSHGRAILRAPTIRVPRDNDDDRSDRRGGAPLGRARAVLRAHGGDVPDGGTPRLHADLLGAARGGHVTGAGAHPRSCRPVLRL